MAVLSGVLTGISGGLQLYSGLKSLFGDDNEKAKSALSKARAAEQAWYKRNYYNDYLNGSMTQSVMKRVRDTLSKNSRQNRAASAVMGTTPEVVLANNSQNLRTMENMLTNLASYEEQRRASVDAQHLQNLYSLNNQQLALEMDEKDNHNLLNGVSLLNKAIDGVNWGKELGLDKNW